MRSELKSFLERTHEATREIDGLELLVLHGSLVRGELTTRSDIDFFAIFHDRKRMISGEGKLSEILEELCEREFGCPASLRSVSHEDKIDPSFLFNVFREGVAIVPFLERMVWDLFSLRPYILLSYGFHGKTPRERVKIHRALFGYCQRKGGRTYEYLGLVDSLGAERVDFALMVPLEKADELCDFFGRAGIRFKRKLCFVPKS